MLPRFQPCWAPWQFDSFISVTLGAIKVSSIQEETVGVSSGNVLAKTTIIIIISYGNVLSKTTKIIIISSGNVLSKTTIIIIT